MMLQVHQLFLCFQRHKCLGIILKREWEKTPNWSSKDMLMATDFHFFFSSELCCFVADCLPSASWVRKEPNSCSTPRPMIFHSSCSLTAVLWSWWLCSPLCSGGHTQATEQGCSYRPTVNRDSTCGLKSSLEATLKGRIAIQRRSLKKIQFLYSHVLNFTIVILYIVWNKIQTLYFLLETNTEVFKSNPGFIGNGNIFWWCFGLWFSPCLALRISISSFWCLFCIYTDTVTFLCKDKKTHRANTVTICKLK